VAAPKRATLRETASKMKSVQTELVAQRAKQRHVRIVGVQDFGLAIDCQLDLDGHVVDPVSARSRAMKS
jgi:hypothetical protein